MGVLRERVDAPVDWAALTERHYLGTMNDMIDAVLGSAAEHTGRTS